jgi:signal transduction histidine kinase
LRLVIGDVLALAADELTTRKIKLTSRMPEEPLIANVDADLLKQAVLNVIQNGAQAMPEGGRLEVTLEEDRSADGALLPQARRNGVDGVRTAYTAPRFAVLRIADEGEGIPAEIREKIFDLYFTTKTGGSGIGLAMTYRILQFHHGSVDVQSRQGRGTEFLLRIPLSAADRVHRAQQPASIPSDTELGK